MSIERGRILLVFIFFLGLWSLLLFKGLALQLAPDPRIVKLKQKKFNSVVQLQGRRGAILDAEGRELATSVQSYSLYADPKVLERKAWVAKNLSQILNLERDSIFSKIRGPEKRFVWIQRQMEDSKSKAVQEWLKKQKIRGLGLVEEAKRIYPNEKLFSSVLGFVGREGQGLEGLELQYEEILRGPRFKFNIKRDARGRPLDSEDLFFSETPEGAELKLSLDSNLQFFLEQELRSAVSHFKAQGAVGVVLEAKGSAIRALANGSGYDPNRAAQFRPEDRRASFVTDMFEPASTLKSFILARALELNKISLDSKIFCENGFFRVKDRVIREADQEHKFGWLTPAQILAWSSNVGASKVGFLLGDEEVRSALEIFGFGQKTGVDFPGESRGSLQPLPWRPHLLANISFGHGVAVNALQLANAYAALINGGELYQPRILDEVRDLNSGEWKKNQEILVRRVISKEISEKMRILLVGATDKDSTGFQARLPGFLVGGKTGTAQKVNPEGRGYKSGAYISSFVGFFPAQEPKYVVLISIDEPQGLYYGSQVAAPLFTRIAGYISRKEAMSPMASFPETREKKEPHKDHLGEANNSVVPLGSKLVPRLQNLSLREVLRQLENNRDRIKIRGQGVVVRTSPMAGEAWEENQDLQIFLEPNKETN